MKESYFSRVEFASLLDDAWRELCGMKPGEELQLVTHHRASDIEMVCGWIKGPIYKLQYEISEGQNKVQFEIELPHISYRDCVSEEFIAETITKLKALESEIRPSEASPNTDDYNFKIMAADRVGAFARKIEEKTEYARAVMEGKTVYA